MRRPGAGEVDELDDAALLRLVVARRTDAFAELYRRHAFAVAAVAARTANDRSSADDITQAAFLALWTGAARLNVASGSLRAWLVTVARNAAIDRARRLRLAAPLEHVPEPRAADGDPEERAVQRESQRDVRRALASLDPDQRTAIELAYFGGLSQTEIAAATGAPLGTVKGRIRLGMQHLRRALAPAVGDPA